MPASQHVTKESLRHLRLAIRTAVGFPKIQVDTLETKVKFNVVSELDLYFAGR